MATPFATANPVEQLIALASGHWVSRALWAAARLRIADAVGEEATPLADIAAATGAHEANLGRLLDALVSLGVFARDADGYRHGAMSPFLRSDHPLSQRAFVDAVFGGVHYDAWGAVDHSIRTGETAFDHVYGMPVFDWYGRNADPAETFSRAMESTTRLLEMALLACWTPPPFALAVDVGGSRGTLLQALLARRPEARGVLFDLPEVIDAVAGDVADGRLQALGGSFFEAVPKGDLYLLKLVLHDWTDAQCAAILRNVRAAIRPGGRVAIIEQLLPETPQPGAPGYLMDLNMMVMTGGRERTAAAFEALLQEAGFTMEGVTTTPLPIGVVQAITA
jgi:hypothetical protein